MREREELSSTCFFCASSTAQRTVQHQGSFLRSARWLVTQPRRPWSTASWNGSNQCLSENGAYRQLWQSYGETDDNPLDFGVPYFWTNSIQCSCLQNSEPNVIIKLHHTAPSTLHILRYLTVHTNSTGPILITLQTLPHHALHTQHFTL